MDWVLGRAGRGESGYVCFATVHMIVEAYDYSEFKDVINGAGLVTPDGMPLVWALRLLGLREARRVSGPDLSPKICKAAAARGIKVGFYGGTPEVLDKVVTRMKAIFPEIRIVYACSPPFRALSQEEDEQIVQDIMRSGAQVLFVGLGCPKQENWMRDHTDRIPAIMLGVGAMFNFVGGVIKRAPVWMQTLGLEWVHRIVTEPQRLWKRYLTTNPRFVMLFTIQLLRFGRFP
ncbi:MAG: WecB/TagA/CpsF family glycosyltransferase [Candidatus Sumerlaeota bacterium]|nr:WecB/TagA/CpsF family glycosyltransferase [Candidatus Sumerlaeota bacterium]